ncbi:MAG: translational activator for mitochondrial COX1 [Phylliscum demangeonii]|nr:MAG: translational activator for mitochondrial COX1 [Phylliscum demangeonii]
MEEALVNFTNWDTFLYTREHDAVNEEQSLRQTTRVLTYPTTIGSVLSELSPYNIRMGGRLTPEGLRSFTESSLPRLVWSQLPFMFPRVAFHIILIGPESMINREKEYPLPDRSPLNPFGALIEDQIHQYMKISTFVEYYHTLHQASLFQPFDPYLDCFVLFHPGLGHPASSHEWEPTIPQLLETRVPVLVTGYNEWDMERDWNWVQKTVGGEVDLLMEPGENRFRSLRWELNDLDPQDISCGNWGVWAFRGKRYEAMKSDREEQ